MTPARRLTADEIAANAGMYRSLITGTTVTIGGERNPPNGLRWTFDGRGGAVATDEYGTTQSFERASPAKPSPAELESYAGAYVSDEAETVLQAAVENGTLVVKRRPDTTIALTPLYTDAFDAPQLGTVIFRRDDARRITGLSVSQDRVWDLRFERGGQP